MRAAILLALLALAGAAAIALGAVGEDRSRGEPLVTAAAGSFSLANSRDGMPVFTATGIAPGESAAGTVEIANEGEEAIDLTLSQRDLVDAPGSGGGVLSQRLGLRIEETTSTVPVYQGPLATMPPLALGRLAPGASRTFGFVATLPEGGAPGAAAENAVQGASTSVTYTWMADASPPSAEPAPTPALSAPPAPGTSPPPPARSSRLSVRIVRYRQAIRRGRLLAWARCNRACQVTPHASFSAPKHLGRLRARPNRLPRRHFSARTQRLVLVVPPGPRRKLSAATGRPRVRVTIIARDSSGEKARTSKLLRLQSPAR